MDGHRPTQGAVFQLSCPENRLGQTATPLDLLDYVDHQPVPSEEMLVAWILIDACMGLESGRSRRWIWPKIPQEYSSKSSTHALGLLDVLRLAETLGNLPREVSIYGVSIDDLGRSIDDCIKALVPHIDQLLA